MMQKHAAENLACGTQPTETPDAALPKDSFKATVKALKADKAKAKPFKAVQHDRGTDAKPRKIDADAPEMASTGLTTEAAQTLRNGLMAYTNLMKTAGVMDMLSLSPAASALKGADAGRKAAGPVTIKDQKGVPTAHKTHPGIAGGNKEMLQQLAAGNEVRDDLQNLAIGTGGGAALGLAGGAAYDALAPEGAYKPSVVTTTLGGAGLGTLAALLTNAIRHNTKAKDVK